MQTLFSFISPFGNYQKQTNLLLHFFNPKRKVGLEFTFFFLIYKHYSPNTAQHPITPPITKTKKTQNHQADAVVN